MGKFVKGLCVGLVGVASIGLVASTATTIGKDLYDNGKASVKPQLEQTTNDFALRIQQLQLDLAEKNVENAELKYNIELYQTEIANKTTENTSLQTQVNSLLQEKEELVASGEASQEEINNLNNQISNLQNTISQNEETIANKQLEIDALNEQLSNNTGDVGALNNRIAVLTSIVDKSVVSVSAEDLEGMTNIPNYAFYKCDKLTSIELPQSLLKIDSYAFNGCTRLSSVNLSKCINLTEIGTNAFASCSNLVDVDFTGCASLTIINSNAFSGCSKLLDVELKDCINLTTIGVSAFATCRSLTSIVIPENVVTIDNNAFLNCTALLEVYNLSSLSISRNTTTNGYVGKYAKVIHSSLDEESYIRTIGNGKYYFEEYQMSFNGNISTQYYRYLLTIIDKSATHFEIDSEYKTIWGYAFFGCSNLTSVDLGNVSVIESSAFQGCTALKELVIPESVTNLPSNALNGCTNLETLTLLSSTKVNVSSSSAVPSNLTTIYVPASLLDSYKTASIWSLFADKFVAYVEYTDASAFTFSYDSETAGYKITAFDTNCTDTDIIVPLTYNDGVNGEASITYVDAGAFSGCTNLTNIVLPDSVINIGNNAFGNCTNLISVKLPKNLTTIGSGIFWKCSSLTSVDFSECTLLTEITNQTFVSCTNLTSIILPTSITRIWFNTAFTGCDNLESITILSSTPPEIGTADGISSNVKIYIPYGSLSTYQTTEYWSDLSAQLVELDA